MEKAKDQLKESQPTAGGPARDPGGLRSDAATSTAELREFLGRMRGRTPQEMLGAVAESRLTRSIVLATFLCVLVLAALTVVPYELGRRGADSSASASVAEREAAEDGAAQEQASTPAGQAESAGEPPPPAASPGVDAVDAEQAKMDPQRAVDALGIGETRVADPDRNPLEDKLDKLLDGIE